MRYLQLFLVICLFSCQSRKESYSLHRDLLGSKDQFLSEMGDDNYDSLESELKKGRIDVRYINDIIYISNLRETNACGVYKCNIDINHDTLFLRYDMVSDVVCTSLAIKRLTYFVNNPKGRRYIIEVDE